MKLQDKVAVSNRLIDMLDERYHIEVLTIKFI